MRQFKDTQHVLQLSDLSDVTCEYRDKDIDTVVIERASGFWKERKLTINYPIYPRDNYKWSSAKLREWRATRDPCFIIDLSLSDSLDPRLPANIRRDYTLEFEVRVERTLRDLRECLEKAIRLCLFWGKITSGNAFPEMRLFGWSGKFYFPEIEIR